MSVLSTPDAHTERGLPRRVDVDPTHAPRLHRVGAVAALLGIALLAGGAAAANPVLVLLGLGSTTTSLLRRRLSLDVAVPAAAAAILLAAIAAGLAAGWIGLDLLASPNALLAGYLGYGVVALAVALHRPGRAPTGPRSLLEWLTLAPAGVALATAILQSASVGIAKTWAFWGTDLTRHMTTIKELQGTGALDYATSGYPRGLHMLGALVSIPAAPTARVALMEYDLRLGASLTWLALALMIWTGSVLALRAGAQLGTHRVVAAGAAVAVGAGALLTNTFLLSFVYMGAAPSIAAAAVLQGIPLALLTARDSHDRLARATVVCAIAAVLLAHLWQALVLAPVVAWAVLAVPELRGLSRAFHDRRSRRRLFSAAAISVACAVLAAPPVIAVQQAAGLGYASVPGELGGGPWRVLVPGLVAVVIVALVRRRERWALASLAVAAGLMGTTALLLRGTRDPWNFSQYYPLKSLWFLTLVCAPLLAVVLSIIVGAALHKLWRLLARTGRFAFVLRATAVAALLGPGLAFWLGFLVGVDSSTVSAWHRATPAPHGTRATTTELSAVRFDTAVRFGAVEGRSAVVPWVVGEASFDHYGRFVVSLLLTFQSGQPEMRTGKLDVCDAVTSIAGDRPAIVISQLPRRQVAQAMEKAGCPGRAAIQHVANTGYLG